MNHLPVQNKHSKQSGFTLIELMVSVAIVAILAAVALPMYRNYVISGQINEATTNLTALRAKMEQYYQDNRTYLTNGTIISPCDPTSLSTLNGNLRYFSLSCGASGSATWTATTYTITATGLSGKATNDFTYTLDNNNNQASSTASGSAWGVTSCTSTWKTSKSGC